MKNFLAQFKAMPAAVKFMDFENFIYTQASKMLEGYGGGQWGSKKVGGVWVLALPVKPNANGKIVLNNYAFGGGIETDADTAGAAFTACVVNWYWNMRSEQGRISGPLHAEFESFHRGLRDAVWADNPTHKINTGDYHDFTD